MTSEQRAFHEADIAGAFGLSVKPTSDVDPLEPRCIECVHPDEDPAPWCDCRMGETCAQGPCRRRAHEPRHCPTPGRW